MARSRSIKRRTVNPDPIYKSLLVAKLINRVMKSGKRTVAEAQVYQAMKQLEAETGKQPLVVLEDAIRMITPQMEVRSRRVGGAAYQVPMPVRSNRGQSLALRWLVGEANKRSNKEYHHFYQKLAAEVLEALNETGGAIAKKTTSHKQAEANKAFAHFRW